MQDVKLVQISEQKTECYKTN